ncbi:MAG TPA: ABC transporter ATP-binding protein [Stellaceae bacterium]|jgi:sulfonate transport system ATP-binding protein
MLRIARVSKRFDARGAGAGGGGVFAVADIDLTVERGEIVALVGTSGCGKSTLLRMVGGLETPSAGTIDLDGRPVAGPRPDVGFVFQEPRLMPWLSVRDNVAFGLGKLSRAERASLADAALDRVGLAASAEALPRELSGGMAQRVALARALVTRPSVMLLDEPFSALDAFTRMSLQDHLLEIWRDDRPTMLFVTHDIEEALMLADRVVVMLGRPGRIHRDEPVDLTRPRRRTDVRVARWRERLLDDLSLATAGAADAVAPAVELADDRRRRAANAR